MQLSGDNSRPAAVTPGMDLHPHPPAALAQLQRARLSGDAEMPVAAALAAAEVTLASDHQAAPLALLEDLLGAEIDRQFQDRVTVARRGLDGEHIDSADQPAAPCRSAHQNLHDLHRPAERPAAEQPAAEQEDRRSEPQQDGRRDAERSAGWRWQGVRRGPSRPPPPRPPQDHRQPRHRGRHRQQLLDTLPPPLAVGHARRDLAHEALAVAGRQQQQRKESVAAGLALTAFRGATYSAHRPREAGHQDRQADKGVDVAPPPCADAQAVLGSATVAWVLALPAGGDSKRRLPCAAAGIEIHLDPHLPEHVLHRWPHVIGDHHLDTPFSKKTRDAGVVGALAAGVMEVSPPHVELLPVLELISVQLGDRHPICATPAWVYRALRRERDANNHGAIHATAGPALVRPTVAGALATKPVASSTPPPGPNRSCPFEPLGDQRPLLPLPDAVSV